MYENISEDILISHKDEIILVVRVENNGVVINE